MWCPASCQAEANRNWRCFVGRTRSRNLWGLACPSFTARFVMNLSVTGLWNILGSRAPYAEIDGWSEACLLKDWLVTAHRISPKEQKEQSGFLLWQARWIRLGDARAQILAVRRQQQPQHPEASDAESGCAELGRMRIAMKVPLCSAQAGAHYTLCTELHLQGGRHGV